LQIYKHLSLHKVSTLVLGGLFSLLMFFIKNGYESKLIKTRSCVKIGIWLKNKKWIWTFAISIDDLQYHLKYLLLIDMQRRLPLRTSSCMLELLAVYMFVSWHCINSGLWSIEWD
jgi:hypothetical protein